MTFSVATHKKRQITFLTITCCCTACLPPAGDVNGIEMQVIPQTQFIPLPDSLCLIITELNNGSQPATLDSIRARLHRCYSNTNLPSHQLIYDTLGQLIRERKVIHNGQ